MGDRYLTDLADVLRGAGLDVVELDGWQFRSRGSGGYDSGRPTHVMVHHTASPPSASGASDANYCAYYDEDAPLSNLCLDRDGCWWILAGGATNTNGKGGPLDGVPADSMNTHSIGVEANGGYGYSWPDVQQDSYVRGVATLCQRYGIRYVRGHVEWAPTRKVDPAGQSRWASGAATWNLNAFRNDVTAAQSGQTEGTDDDMPLSDDDVQRIADAVWSKMIDTTGSGEPNPQPARYYLQRSFLLARQYLGGFSGKPPPDQTLLRLIYEQTKK